MNPYRGAVLVAVFLVYSVWVHAGDSFTGRVVKVHDGDTITVERGERVSTLVFSRSIIKLDAFGARLNGLRRCLMESVDKGMGPVTDRPGEIQ